jgi:hypothetical protein
VKGGGVALQGKGVFEKEPGGVSGEGCEGGETIEQKPDGEGSEENTAGGDFKAFCFVF